MKRGHSFQYKVCHWWYCSGCGLIQMNNTASRKAAKQACRGAEE
jgi:hypothetical protein